MSSSIWKIAQKVSEVTGVQFDEQHSTLLNSRLLRRCHLLKLKSIDDYLDYLEKNATTESGPLISLLTTHHTFFFREIEHFRYLEKKFLPGLIDKLRSEGRKTIHVWSAACSNGSEAYTIATFLSHYLKEHAPDFDFEIFGSDVCEESVTFARSGVYPWDQVAEIPQHYLSEYWERGKGEDSDHARMNSEVHSKCTFDVVNLVKLGEKSGRTPFDIVFCRNVFIYFSKEDIAQVTQNLLNRLAPGGALFLGLSESLRGLPLEVDQIGPSVYCKKGEAIGKEPPPEPPIKILTVDDSPTIQKMLKKIFTESSEFQLVGQAEDGLDAKKKIDLLRPDVLTLDIHMPKMDGIEFLEATQGHRPPVVVLSTVSKNDATVASKALSLGAFDYIEKPELANFKRRRDEILGKVLAAVKQSKAKEDPKPSELYRSQKKHLSFVSPNKRLIRLWARSEDEDRVIRFLRNIGRPFPPLYLVLEGEKSEKLSKNDKLVDLGLRIKSEVDVLDLSTIYLVEPDATVGSDQEVMDVVLSGLSENRFREACSKASSYRVIEEDESRRDRIKVTDVQNVLPYFSLSYEVLKRFSRKGHEELLEDPHRARPSVKVVRPNKGEVPRDYRVSRGSALVVLTDPVSKATLATMIHGPKGSKELIEGLRDKLLNRGAISTQLITKVIGFSPLIRELKRHLVSLFGEPKTVREITDSSRVLVYEESSRVRLEKKTPLGKKIKVMVVDDSAPMRKMLIKILTSDPNLEVVGETGKPIEVEGMIQKLQPDLVTMDIHMPVKSGVDLVGELFPKTGIPFLMVSSLNPQEGSDVFRALEMGAFDYVQKPALDQLQECAPVLIEKVKLGATTKKKTRSSHGVTKAGAFDLERPIVIGASTGGPDAIRRLFASFPASIPPVLVIQHIPQHFSKAFAERLNSLFPFEVKEAEDGDELRENRVLVAPGGSQMTLRKGARPTVRVQKGGSGFQYNPSIDQTFESAASVLPSSTIGILLTGMGSDGAKGLKLMRGLGMKTLGQGEESCVVYGMPRAAKMLGAVEHELPLEEMANRIGSKVRQVISKKRAS